MKAGAGDEPCKDELLVGSDIMNLIGYKEKSSENDEVEGT